MINKIMMRRKLEQGVPVIGTWNTLGSPLVTEVIAHSGMDFQIIDFEHGPMDFQQIHLHVSACGLNSGCSPLVRIPSNYDWMALQALDQGAHGIVVPNMINKITTSSFINSIKYHPKGRRGFTPFSKAGGFSNKKIDEYIRISNEQIIGVVIIESKEGMINLEEIVMQDGVDIVYFGVYDLSQSLGHPGNVKHASVIQEIQNGVNIVNKYGKCAGGFVPQSKDEIKWLLDIGMRFITYDVDASILNHHLNDISEWFDNEI